MNTNAISCLHVSSCARKIAAPHTYSASPCSQPDHDYYRCQVQPAYTFSISSTPAANSTAQNVPECILQLTPVTSYNQVAINFSA